MYQQLRGVSVGTRIFNPPTCHEVHLAMGDGGIIADLIHLAMLPHHLVVRVYEEAAPVFVSACVEAGPVRHETLDVVDGHLGVDFVASRYDDIFFHLDTAGPPEDEKSASTLHICTQQTDTATAPHCQCCNLLCFIFEREARVGVPGGGIQHLRGLLTVVAPNDQGPGRRGPYRVVGSLLHQLV